MAYEHESKETRALKSISSKQYPDTNKDFVKNIQRLNSSVDYLSSYMIVMQKGIDDANKNVIEQIQSFINDLIVLFAGGEPTGIELGDLKYIIMGIGALFGLNGPFPLSLIEAAMHFFLGYVVPLPQFTDVITDAILAWAEELGLDPAFITELRKFTDAITTLAIDIGDLLEKVLSIFDIFGIIDPVGTGPLAVIWDILVTLFDGINAAAFKPILDVITTWTLPFVQGLTQLINFIDFLVNALENNLFLKVGDPIHAAQLIGRIPARLISMVSIGSMTNEITNLLPDGSFAPGSIQMSPDWIEDSAGSRTGDDGTGAAKVIADGKPHALRSGVTATDVVAVTPGNPYLVRAFVKHQDYVGTGDAIKLQIVTYRGSERGDVIPIATYAPAEANLDWPGKELAGTYIVEPGVTGVQTRLYVSEEATSGSIWFDDVSTGSSAKLRPEWIDGLPEALQEMLNRWQMLIDTIFNAITRTGRTFLNTLDDIEHALQNIPFLNIVSALGSENLGKDAIEIINSIVGGFVGVVGAGASPADVFNIGKMISEWASRGNKAKEITDTRTNKKATAGLGISEGSNFDLGLADTWITVTPTASAVGYDYVEGDMPLGAISWIGYGSSGVTGLYINVWKVNLATGEQTPIHSSANIVGLLAGVATASPGTFLQYNLPAPVGIHISELLGYEVITVGGNHTIRGRIYTLPAHPTAPITKLAASRNASASPSTPPSSIAKASVGWGDNAPWIGIAVDNGNGIGYHDPQLIYLGTEATTMPIPDWTDAVVPAICGDGGGGHLGGSWGIAGADGTPGKWATGYWKRGVDFSGSGTIITFTPGPGGTPGHSPFATDGGDGDGTTISIPGSTLTAEGGKGGTGIRAVAIIGPPVGRGPGDITIGPAGYEQPIQAGKDQHAYGGNGMAPGGGGNGGDWAFVSAGGHGAPGGGWVLLLPKELSDTPPEENTPPTAPTLTLISQSYSGFVVGFSGATD